MLQAAIDFIVALVQDFGYAGIIFMMFLESSFFPFPSEVAMIPAGYLAQKGQMNIYLVIASGTLGSILGSLLNYYIALILGRKFIVRYGKYVLFGEDEMQKVESFFARHGSISTFSGRFIPVLRQYISFPAGLARMNLAKFCLYTGLGAGIWVAILALLGFYLGQDEARIREYLHVILLAIAVFLAALLAVYYRFKVKK
ncbi:MAG: DedA family protein [Helicobacteraceae bacterium]